MNKDKFDWNASESAPKKNPMSIVSGDLHYHDGSGSLYVPNGSDISNGWGLGISSHVTGEQYKPLPNKLTLTFFSYLENQFYQGRFDLPYDKILSMFKTGYATPEGKHTTYDTVIVGVAPGGAVAVWLAGQYKTTEVFFGQAEKINLEWSHFTAATHISREEYVRSSVEESLNKYPGALEAFRKNGPIFGLWTRYRTRYPWQPQFTGMTIRDGLMGLNYFNGEDDFLITPLEPAIAASTRAVPSKLSFTWEYSPGQGRGYDLTFNETEIFDAFKKLGNNPPLKLEMRMTQVNAAPVFSVWLRNDKDAIELKNTRVKTYSVRGRKADGAR